MPSILGWHGIVVRLVLSIVAGALVGIGGVEHDRRLGLRTNMLVCLAASIAMMIQLNLLVRMAGRPSDSEMMLDLVNPPFWILTGIGLIGGIVTLRCDHLVLGLRRAATLCFVAVMGLCFGGGQFGLGITALVLGILALSDFRRFESRRASNDRRR
jgi:putative Mg2+ transporter-C (MgtC) family protein